MSRETTANSNTAASAETVSVLKLVKSAIDSSSVNYQYYLDYDYDEQRHCFEEGCHEEGICRCSTLSGEHVTSVDAALVASCILDAYSDKARSLWEQKARVANPRSRKRAPKVALSELDRAGMDWIVRAQGLDGSDFDVSTSRGYYGEEVDGIAMSSDCQLRIDKIAKEYLSMPQDATLRFRWLFEGSQQTLPKVFENKEVVLGKVNVKSIKPVADDADVRSVWADEEDTSTATDLTYPVAVVEETEPGVYVVVHGHKSVEAYQVSSKRIMPVWILTRP